MPIVHRLFYMLQIQLKILLILMEYSVYFYKNELSNMNASNLVVDIQKICGRLKLLLRLILAIMKNI